MAAMGEPAGAGDALPRDGDTEDQAGPRRRQPADARAPGAMETGRAASRGRRARSCGVGSRRRRTRCSAARPRTSRRSARSARANLAKKQALVRAAEALAELERLGTNRDGDPGAPGGMEDHRAGHARAREGRSWERFRGACDRFFTRRQDDLKQRKEQWTANLARKEALCAKAEALADSTDWEAAAAQMRALQAEWKTVGPVRKSKSERVWQRFREACDRFFERYKHRDQLELAAKAAPRESGHSGAGSAPAGRRGHPRRPPPDGLSVVVQHARGRWQQAPELPRHVQQELAARYHGRSARLVDDLAGGVRRYRPRSGCHAATDGKAAGGVSRNCLRLRVRPSSSCRRPNGWRSSCASGWPPTRSRAGAVPSRKRKRDGAPPNKKFGARRRSGCVWDPCQPTSPARSTSGSSARAGDSSISGSRSRCQRVR